MTRRQLLASALAVKLPRKIRLGIIGFDGHPGEITGPLPQLPDVEVVAICDADPKVLERVAKNPRLASAKRYNDYKRMLEAETFDVVAVCNNNGERAAAVLACAERKLNMIAEKPLSLRMDDLERIKKTVARNNVRVGMLLPMRYASPYRALKQIVDSGEIGEVVQIGSQKSYVAGNRPAWMRNRETFGGTIPWIGVHMIDLMRFTSGREFIEAASFQARIGLPEGGDMETVTSSMFRLDNQGVAVLRMDYFRPASAGSHGDDRLRLAGTKGIAEYMAATGVTVVSTGAKPRKVEQLPEGGSVFIDYLEAVYNGKPETLTLTDIYRVTEITLRAHEAAERHAIVKI